MKPWRGGPTLRSSACLLALLAGLPALLPGCRAKDAPPPAPASQVAAPAPAVAAGTAAATPAKLLLFAGVPHEQQRPDFCGEACVTMYLKKLGWTGTQDDVFHVSGTDPLKGRGAYAPELATAIAALGGAGGLLATRYPRADQAAAGEQQWQAALADLQAGVPSIICTHYDASPTTTEHFRLLLGYDPATDEVIYHEPAVADAAYRRMARATWLKLWPLPAPPLPAPGGAAAAAPSAPAAIPALVYLRLPLDFRGVDLHPKAAPARAWPGGISDAALAQHVMTLRAKGSLDAFTLVDMRPFLVLGDDPPAAVRQRASYTVGWATKRYRERYFAKDPAELIDIWLYANKDSYTGHVKERFGAAPDTPYGYFSHSERAMVMNISTGGGTLVHELLHAYMEANFPACPAWFNEGMGSLYEQSNERDGHIIGTTNWRLAGLQKAIDAKTLLSFKDLCATTSEQFYHDRADHYAQARYLCYYLQEHNLLVPYYQAFTKAQATDPSGWQTLLATLHLTEAQMPAWQAEWEKWAMTLHFP